MKIKIDININVNKVVKYMVLTDLLFTGSWSFISPIFSIFVIKDIAGATIVTAGMAAALYWMTKSLLQIPIANFLDRTEGEKDDFYALVFSVMLAGFAAFSFILVRTIAGLFIVQMLYAIAMSFYIPAWSGLFSRHLDQKRYSFDWSLDSTAIGLTAFVTSLVGSIMAEWLGFQIVFLIVGAFSLFSATMLYFAPNIFLPKQTAKKELPVALKDHSSSTNIGSGL
ncbi:MAG: MFS transporter [Patescibacteria group bacterium]|nr:MFS transporter [Patescibacteria group bacterium]